LFIHRTAVYLLPTAVTFHQTAVYLLRTAAPGKKHARSLRPRAASFVEDAHVFLARRIALATWTTRRKMTVQQTSLVGLDLLRAPGAGSTVRCPPGVEV
jgi:hypothetical protein